MSETEEDWVRLAMSDTCLVARLLLRLLRHPPPSSWAVRGPRTRPQPKQQDAAPTARASPSTPLWWSGAEDSPPDDCNAYYYLPTRSKASLASGGPTTTSSAALAITPCKPPRQKKRSLFQLKEEESLLRKERQSLEQELATLRLRVEKERATNESLKRLKANTASTRQGQRSPRIHHKQRDAAAVYLEETPRQLRVTDGCSGQNKPEATPGMASLPDLNLPPEE